MDNGVDTTSSMQGNLEVLGWDGVWRSVCNKGWGQVDAQVLCNQLGFTGPAQAVKGYFASDNHDYYFSRVRCEAGDENILGCLHNEEDAQNCAEGMQAGVICSAAGPSK